MAAAPASKSKPPTLAQGKAATYIGAERNEAPMLRFVALVVAGLLMWTAGGLARVLRHPLARLLRGVTAVAAATLGIAGLAILAAGLQDGAAWAVIVGGGMGLGALRLAWMLRAPRRRLERFEPRPAVRSAPDGRWKRFEAGFDWASRAQVRRHRAEIERFVAERDSPSLTHEHRALLLSCEKRVPELIDACLERCANASRKERQAYCDETLGRLAQIATEAARARTEVRAADDQRLQVLHRYFDNVVGGGAGQPSRS